MKECTITMHVADAVDSAERLAAESRRNTALDNLSLLRYENRQIADLLHSGLLSVLRANEGLAKALATELRAYDCEEEDTVVYPHEGPAFDYGEPPPFVD